VGRFFFLEIWVVCLPTDELFLLDHTCYENASTRDLRVKVALVNVLSAVTIADLLLKFLQTVHLAYADLLRGKNIIHTAEAIKANMLEGFM